MDSNTYSAQPPRRRPSGLASVVAAVEVLAAEDPDRLSDPAVADQAWRCGSWWTASKANGSGPWRS